MPSISPALRFLAMEPLEMAIRSSPDMQGFRRVVGEERIALYAEDVLLFLGDTQSSLVTVMNINKDFRFSLGLTINSGENRCFFL